ncbi:MAG: ABC transporter ATP-binding protein [Gemmatimonadales bacterium]|nr:MAG: ABC transporter ATP-binding protein [Gemmatimonadales bacterium]
MSDLAIAASGVGKRYRIGTAQVQHNTLRDALASSTRRLWSSMTSPGDRAEPDHFWALQDVSFQLRQGEVLGIIGSNGAGKSTLLKILSRITEPTTGEIAIRGRVGSLLEVGTGFHSELTGRENIFLNGAILGMTRQEIRGKFDEIVDFAEIDRFIDTPVKHYSSGMYLRLGFAVAAHLEPEILIVDEVLAVGDADFQRKCLGKMGSIAVGGRTVVFVSHNLDAVQALCTRALLLDEGRVLSDGPTHQVLEQYAKSRLDSVSRKSWPEPQSAPGNDTVRLKGARILAEDGADTIDVRTPFRLEFEYWNLVPDTRLSLSVHVYNHHGVRIFNVGSTKEPTSQPAGLVRETCSVPGDLMNSGTYHLELIVLRDQTEAVLKFEDLLVWEIADNPDLRAGWYGEWPGAVRPNLPWRIDRIDEDGEATGRDAAGVP